MTTVHKPAGGHRHAECRAKDGTSVRYADGGRLTGDFHTRSGPYEAKKSPQIVSLDRFPPPPQPPVADWRTKLDTHAQLINIVNGPSHGGADPGSPSESEFLRYLNLGLHVAPTADQDNHRKKWGSAAETRTGVIAASLTKPEILAALRARHVYASEDRNLRVIAKVNDELMGTRFQGDEVPSPGSELDIEIELNDDDEPTALYTIDVYADHAGGDEVADILRRVNASDNGVVTVDGIEYSGGRQYFFFKIRQTDDDGVEVDHAWTAPVWFEPDGDTEEPSDPVLTLEVNLATEEATITNVGEDRVNLSGWTLVSVQGDQRYSFPAQDRWLEPGETVIVTSGPNASDDPPYVKWTGTYIWRNSGDPGQLLDDAGQLQAETQ